MAEHRCDFCGARFQRSEHLSRHRLLHLGERPFHCSRCDRSFTRRDTLQRHLVVHEARSLQDDSRSIRPRRAKKACISCSQSKQRCDGKQSCSRCLSRGQTCVYAASNASESDGKPRPRDEVGEDVMQDDAGGGDSQSLWPEVHDRAGDDGSFPSSQAPDAWIADAQQNLEGTSAPLDDASLADTYNMRRSAVPSASQHNAVLSESSIGNAIPTPQCAETDILAMNAQDLIFWDDPQLLDDPQCLNTLYQGPYTEYAFMASMSETDLVHADTTLYAEEPELDQNMTSAPVPSFLDARSSPEPNEGQNIHWDDYIRKTFGNRRHLRGAEGRGVGTTGREKAHLPPLIGDFAPALSSAENIWEAENLAHVKALPQEVYDTVVAEYLRFNTAGPHSTPFARGQFPGIAACNAFIQLYFEEFNPTLPFLHQPTFDPAVEPWLLVLAVIATGCRFSRISAAVQAGDIMQEFLRRAFAATIEQDYSSTCEPWLAQAGLLNQIGMAFSKDMRLTQSAQSMRSLLASIARQVNCFQEPRRPAGSADVQMTVDEAWQAWIRREGRRRLAYAIWLVDSQYMLYFDLPPVIPTNLIRVRLPAPERQWHCQTASSWLECARRQGTYLPLSIRQELDNLYTTGVRQRGLGDFAVLLLVLGVFRGAIEVKRAFQEGSSLLFTGLGQGMPTLSTESEASVQATDKAMNFLRILCPDDDDEASYKRSTLQTAILHHYHSIGVLLRVSLGEVFCYCGYRVTATDIAHCEERLQKWVRQRGNEARQVALHAGRLFGSLRSSDLRAYHDCRAMFLASQVLWIYAAIASPQTPSSGGNTDLHGRPVLLSTIRLDQTLSRQLEESWLTDGARMHPCLAGVGGILGDQGVRRLVQEGCRVLCGSSTWPMTRVLGKCLGLYYQTRLGTSLSDPA